MGTEGNLVCRGFWDAYQIPTTPMIHLDVADFFGGEIAQKCRWARASVQRNPPRADRASAFGSVPMEPKGPAQSDLCLVQVKKLTC